MKTWLLLLVGLSTNFFGFHALAEERLALLIGNQTYGPKVGALHNPINDVNLVGKSLREVGFKVVIEPNLARAPMMRAIAQFVDRLSGAGPGAVGFFYYSGHGASNPRNHNNYLIPTDVLDMQDAYVWENAISLEEILSKLEHGAPTALRFVVFDACRNELQLPFKGATKAFSFQQYKSGSFIAFSTSPDAVAADRDPGGTDSGPYAKILSSELTIPGQDHLHLFANVAERVEATITTQKPWMLVGAVRPFYFAGEPQSEAKRIWEEFGGQTTTDINFLQGFVSLYGKTEQGDFARNRLVDIAAQRKASAAEIRNERKLRRQTPGLSEPAEIEEDEPSSQPGHMNPSSQPLKPPSTPPLSGSDPRLWDPLTPPLLGSDRLLGRR